MSELQKNDTATIAADGTLFQEAPRSYIWHVGLSFNLTFGAYFAMQNMLTTIMPESGFLVLALLTATICGCMNLAPNVNRFLGCRAVFVLGACSAMFIVGSVAMAAIYPDAEPLVFVGAILCLSLIHI